MPYKEVINSFVLSKLTMVTDELDKDVILDAMKYYSAIQKGRNLPFVVTWM